MFSVEQLAVVSDILNGAAYADGSKAPFEAAAIEEALAEMVGGELDASLVARIRTGLPEEFDLNKACEALQIWKPEDRRKREMLFRLIARVTEVDDVLDANENRYLIDVARLVGAGKHELEDLKGRGGWITPVDKDL